MNELLAGRCFDFRGEEEIRLKGTRVGIEIVLSEYLAGRTAEEIALNYPALSLEQIHASVTYFLHNRSAMDRYLARWRAFGSEARAAQERHLPEVVIRLREIAKARRARLLSQAGNPS
ncbi:MAG: DUF433 domain-containing protein [candidate division NC10 bacterium]|nr:DUF433 domain-containing protein [candidate division NC10 bacterium]